MARLRRPTPDLGLARLGPLSGYLSDRFGAWPFATGGMLVAAGSFLGLLLLPVNFPYWAFAGWLLVSGIGGCLFMSPNMAGIMNSVPARQRGAAAGMRPTFQNAGMVVSIAGLRRRWYSAICSRVFGTALGEMIRVTVTLDTTFRVD
jgi:MFS family permease